MRDNGTGTSGLPLPLVALSLGDERWSDLRCGRGNPRLAAATGGKSGNPHDRIIALNKIKKIINTCLGTMFLSKLSLGDRGQLREVRGRLDLVESRDWGYSRTLANNRNNKLHQDC